VKVVRALYERFRQIIHEFAKFGVVGVIGLLITNAGYALFHSHFGWGPVTATTVATVIATAVTYVGNRYWSFSHRQRTGVAREGIIFFVLNGIGLLIQDAAVSFNYYVLGLGGHKLAEFLALNIGIGLATLFRFWSYRRFVWANPAAEGPAATAGETAPPDQPLVPGPETSPQARGGRYVPVEVPSEVPGANGHAPADRAARNGSYSTR
jgi:putative flippase GtrA